MLDIEYSVATPLTSSGLAGIGYSSASVPKRGVSFRARLLRGQTKDIIGLSSLRQMRGKLCARAALSPVLCRRSLWSHHVCTPHLTWRACLWLSFSSRGCGGGCTARSLPPHTRCRRQRQCSMTSRVHYAAWTQAHGSGRGCFVLVATRERQRQVS